jgi:hypothetical protein
VEAQRAIKSLCLMIMIITNNEIQFSSRATALNLCANDHTMNSSSTRNSYCLQSNMLEIIMFSKSITYFLLGKDLFIT